MSRRDTKPPDGGRPEAQEPELQDEERRLLEEYSGPALEAWYERLRKASPDRDLTGIDVPRIYLDARSTRMVHAYVRLQGLMDDRSKGAFKAFLSNLWRRPPGLKDVSAGTAVGGILVFAVGWVVAVPAAIGVTVARNVIQTRKLLNSRAGQPFPDLPEFKNDWAVQSYRFIRQVNGYNARVAAAERLCQFKLMPRTADDVAKLLYGAYLRLWKNMQTLGSLAPEVIKAKRGIEVVEVMASEEQNRILRQILPMWDPDLDWLPLDGDWVPPGNEFDRLREDLTAIQSLRDIDGEAKEE